MKRVPRICDMASLHTGRAFGAKKVVIKTLEGDNIPHVHIRTREYDAAFLIRTGEPFIKSSGRMHGTYLPSEEVINEWRKELQPWLNTPYKAPGATNRDYALLEYCKVLKDSVVKDYIEAWEEFIVAWEGKWRKVPDELLNDSFIPGYIKSIRDVHIFDDYDVYFIDRIDLGGVKYDLYASEEFTDDDEPRIWIGNSYHRVCFTLRGEYYGYELHKPRMDFIQSARDYLSTNWDKPVSTAYSTGNTTLKEVAFTRFFQENQRHMDSREYWLQELFGRN